MRSKSVVAEAREVGARHRADRARRAPAGAGIGNPAVPRAPAAALQGAAGKSPPKGMLPFSTDWFITWMPNIHASLFLGIYQHLIKVSELDDIDAIIKAYRLYLEQCSAHGAGGRAVGHARLAPGQVRRRRDAAARAVHLLPRRVRRARVRPARATTYAACAHMPSRAGKKRPPAAAVCREPAALQPRRPRRRSSFPRFAAEIRLELRARAALLPGNQAACWSSSDM